MNSIDLALRPCAMTSSAVNLNASRVRAPDAQGPLHRASAHCWDNWRACEPYGQRDSDGDDPRPGTQAESLRHAPAGKIATCRMTAYGPDSTSCWSDKVRNVRV